MRPGNWSKQNPSPLHLPALLLNKVLQKFGEKEVSRVALFGRVMVGQVQGYRGGSWSTDTFLCLPSVLMAWSRWFVPALDVFLGPSFPALCSTCTCCVPWAVFPPLCGFPVASSCMKSRLTQTQILSGNLLEVEVTPLLGGIADLIRFYSSKTKETAGNPTVHMAWLEELSKEPGPVSVSGLVAPWTDGASPAQ